MSRIDDAYDAWIELNSTKDDVRQLAAIITYNALREAIQVPAHKHLFINRFFMNSLISGLAETLERWPEEVAAWRAILRMTEEMDSDSRLAS